MVTSLVVPWAHPEYLVLEFESILTKINKLFCTITEPTSFDLLETGLLAISFSNGVLSIPTIELDEQINLAVEVIEWNCIIVLIGDLEIIIFSKNLYNFGPVGISNGLGIQKSDIVTFIVPVGNHLPEGVLNLEQSFHVIDCSPLERGSGDGVVVDSSR